MPHYTIGQLRELGHRPSTAGQSAPWRCGPDQKQAERELSSEDRPLGFRKLWSVKIITVAHSAQRLLWATPCIWMGRRRKEPLLWCDGVLWGATEGAQAVGSDIPGFQS